MCTKLINFIPIFTLLLVKLTHRMIHVPDFLTLLWLVVETNLFSFCCPVRI